MLTFVSIAVLSFDRFKSKKGDGGEKDKEKEDSKVVLAWPAGADKGRVTAAAASTFLVRDLITTPCEDMGPQHLEVSEAYKFCFIFQSL